jgi:hypothetical protein
MHAANAVVLFSKLNAKNKAKLRFRSLLGKNGFEHIPALRSWRVRQRNLGLGLSTMTDLWTMLARARKGNRLG